MKHIIFAFLAISNAMNVSAQPQNDAEDYSDLTPEQRAFLFDDSEFKAREISSGELKFLDPSGVPEGYWLHNIINIDQSSLKTGWVQFEQCHYELDPTNLITITYNKDRTKNLAVKHSLGIEKHTIIDTHIDLKNIQKGAEICVFGETKTLHKTPQGFVMKRGPYMRRFLDGYYPMHVEESITYNPKIYPDIKYYINQLGRTFKLEYNSINAQYWFEGELKPEYVFKALKAVE